MASEKPTPVVSDDISKNELTYESAGNLERNSLQGEGKFDDNVARITDHKAERALCRKFDVRLMPVLAIMCK